MKLKSNCKDKEKLLIDETLFHVANGYLGVRGNLEEGSDDPKSIRGCYINGFYDSVELSYPERLYGFPQHAQRMINLPDVQTMKVLFNGNMLANAIECERELDTSLGITKRRMKYAVDSGYITATFIRMASFTHSELFLTLLEIEAENITGNLEIHAGIDCNVENYTNPDDPRVAAEAIKHFSMTKAEKLVDGGFVKCTTSGSGLDFAVVQRLKVSNGQIEAGKTSDGIGIKVSSIEINANAKGPEATIVIEKYTALSDSRRQSNPFKHAMEITEKCMTIGVESLIEEQKAYLDEFWNVAAIETEGFAEAQEALEFNLYQLLQSTGRDGLSSIAAKGISGEGYEGHYFWDSEIYIFPFFLFTKPEIAKSMLDYRYSILDGAKAHAEIMGHTKGALYPWRTISGSECSSYYPSGSAQYHINGDIAHAFMQYWYATADMDYMAHKGAEVLVETARLWLDVGHYDSKGKFNIHAVTGPDEYTCVINNNYYTNRCAQANLQGAADICKMLWQENAAEQVENATGITLEEVELFEKAAANMLLPYDEERNIHAQDDSFLEKRIWDISQTPKEKFPLLLHYHPLHLYRHQVCKQADTVLAHVLYEDGVEESTMLNSFNYYEKITTHDSSLSKCAFCIMASRLGMDDKAYDYFNDILWTDIKDLHGNVKDGLHTANLGGSWLAVVMGFAGMRINEKGLHFKFTQPEKWDKTSFRLRYLDCLLNIQMDCGKVTINLEEGKSVKIFIDETQFQLDEMREIMVQSQQFMLNT